MSCFISKITPDISLSQNINNEKTTKITTSVISEKDTIKFLKKGIKSWTKHAGIRDFLIQTSEDIPKKEKKAAIGRHFSLLVSLHNNLSNISKHEKVYIAYDQDNVIQGVAIATLRKSRNELDLIVSNPENQPLLGYEKPTRGAGTAIITHIGHDILAKRKGSKKLYLESVPQAKDFYKTLGFVRTKEKSDELKPMVLKKGGIKDLINKNLLNMKIREKEPKKSDLKFPEKHHFEAKITVS